MNPDNQQFSSQPQDFSIDYLNQISAPTPKRGPASKIIFVLFGAVGLLILAIILGAIFSGGPKSTAEQTTELYMRLSVLRDVSKSQQESLRSNKLRSYNSSLSLFLTNGVNDLTTAMAEDGIVADDVESSDTFTASQTALKTELNDTFEEASLNVRLDRTYAIEMAYQLNVIGSLITAIKGKDTDPKMQEFITNNADNFKTVSEQLSTFSDS